MLPPEFFDRGPRTVARALLGTVLRRRYKKHWLSVRIVETEAYEKREKGS
ncbi:MAG: DNA-3-methyladenine glycosylase, partial [Myxococcota bacterium]